MRRTGGFTLLELLVAVALLGVIAAMAYGGLGSVLRTDESLESRLAALTELQTALGLLERDLGMAVARPVRDGLGGTEPAMISRAVPERRLSFTRGGQRLPPGLRRSALQRVEYGLVDTALVRSHWRRLDRTPGARPLQTELLRGVDALTLRFLERGGGWRSDWPPERAPGDAQMLPAAVELRLDHDRWGDLRVVTAVAP